MDESFYKKVALNPYKMFIPSVEKSTNLRDNKECLGCTAMKVCIDRNERFERYLYGTNERVSNPVAEIAVCGMLQKEAQDA